MLNEDENKPKSFILTFDKNWGDYALPSANSRLTNLALCRSVVQQWWDVEGDVIKVTISHRSRVGVTDHQVVAGRDGHYFIRKPLSGDYMRHYAYEAAQVILNECYDDWDTDLLYISIEELKDE